MTIFAVSDNENKPVHTGSLFDIKDGVLNVVSVDGYRLAIRREAISAGEDYAFVTPGSALREVERLCQDDDTPANISLGSSHITFDLGDVILMTRRLEGEFLKYETSIPKRVDYMVTADTKELQSAVERVSLIISEKLKNPIRCVFGNNSLKLSCQTSLGTANDEIAIAGDGGEVEIGFNNRYLSDAIKAVPDDKMTVELTNGLSPCVIRPCEGNSYLFMVLPVRLKA